jgi:hypothetical protein
MLGDSTAEGGEKGLRPVIKLPAEPVLDGVLEEDRTTVKNLIYVMHSFKMCKSWSVLPKNHGYEVIGMIDPSHEIELRDLELLKSVDTLRVHSICVRMISGPVCAFSIVVMVLRKTEPIILEEQDVVCIKRKRSFWNWSRGA